MIVLIRALIDIPGLGYAIGVRPLQDTAVIYQSAQRSHRVGAAAESKQIDLIATGVVLNDVTIAIENILVNTPSGGTRAHIVVIGAQTPVIEHVLFELPCGGFDRASEAQDIGWKILLDVFLWSIPGAVGTDYDVGHVLFPFS